MAKGGFGSTLLRKVSKKRPGVHAKAKSSKSKNSRNYKKAYRGQGRQYGLYTTHWCRAKMS